MTEDGLVAALRTIAEAPALGSGRNARIVLGIGDDAAVWQPSRSHLSVVTTDALVDGVHFDSARMAARAVGARAMAANLSDIAAMGARPILATVALGVAPGTDEAWILACYRGMADLAARFDAEIVGGDIVRAPAATLALTVVGEVSRSRLKRRSGGRPGDVIAVTGPLGASRAGLELMRRDLAVPDDVRTSARAAFETPQPRVREGRYLAASAHVNAMMDSSDGLSTDLARLARASGCGATIDRVPMDPVAEAVARATGDDAESYALHGGEDFELIVAVRPNGFEHLAARFRSAFGKPLIRVGRLSAETGLRREGAAGAADLEPAGYEHLA